MVVESAAAQCGQKMCTVTCGGLFPGCLLVVLRFFLLFSHCWRNLDVVTRVQTQHPGIHPSIQPLLTSPCLSRRWDCSGSTNMAEEVCGLGEAISSGLAFIFFCTETGSPTHTDTLLLNSDHLCLATNTSSPPSCCPQSQSQLFPKELHCPPPHLTHTITHSLFYIHTLGIPTHLFLFLNLANVLFFYRCF